MGVSSAIPILLQNRGVTYAEQAIFTFAFYPFTCEPKQSVAKKPVFNL